MLGMYDMPAVQPANTRFWHAIQAHLGDGPVDLDRDGDFWEIWQSPDLVLAQTCGLPYRTRLHDAVTLIGTPDYGLPDCPPGFYYSALVVRADASGSDVTDFDGSIFAYNESMSQSGWAAPTAHLTAAGVSFRSLVQTGAHAASAQAVVDGQADMAGLDALTWALLQDHWDQASQLRVIATTAPTPGLPYITAKTRDPAPIAAAIRAAINGLPPADRSALHLKGLADIPKSAYLAIPNPPSP